MKSNRQTIFTACVAMSFIIVSLLSCKDKEAATSVTGNVSPATTAEASMSIPKDSVVNRSFVASTGDRFLRMEVIIPASIDSVWEAFSTVSGVKTWMAPVSSLDFKVGGAMENNMDHMSRVGDPGTLLLGITNYIPKEMVTYKVNLGKYFGAGPDSEDKNLQEVVTMSAIDNNNTRIVSNMVGWGSGPDWDKAYAFFSVGNKWCYDMLVKRFRTGPVDWAARTK